MRINPPIPNDYCPELGGFSVYIEIRINSLYGSGLYFDTDIKQSE